MLDLDSLTLSMIIGVALIIIWIFYFWVYRAYRVDKTRQDLFELRDELFDLAADGQISFDHQAYTFLRIMINGMIRFAHQLDFLNVLALLYVSWRHKYVPTSVMIRFIKAVETIDSPEAKRKVKDIFVRTNMVIARHLILGSIPLMLILTIAAAVLIIRLGWAKFIEKLGGGELPGIAQLDARAAAEPA